MRAALSAGLVPALFALLAPAGAAARPHVAEFGLAVPAPLAARAASAHPRVVTPVLTTGRRFDLVGLRWQGPGAIRDGELRARINGRWRRWVPLSAAADHGPDAAAPTRGTDPVWVGGGDALQLRWRSAPRGLRLRFVRVTHRVRLPAPRAKPAQAGAPPAMIMRSDWDPGNQCKPRTSPLIGRVQLAFVHHTVSANDYRPETSPAIVLAVCRYHRNANGWNDIGYNFVVDKYGRLFEGRAGGIERAVVGAQAQGFNSESTSVSNIGTYSDVPQTDAALAAMADLLSWKLRLHGVPVTGKVTVVSGGGSENRYPSGQHVTFERISGHRDGGLTECPGNALYAQLPHLRELTAQRAGGGSGVPAPPGAISLTALSTALLYPEPARLSGSLSGGGQVWVQVAAGAAYRTVARTTPAADGSWALELPLTRGHELRALQVLPDGSHGAASAPVRISLTPVVTAGAPRRVLAGTALPVKGTIGPHERSLIASVWIQNRDGSYAFARRVDVAAQRGRFSARLPLRRPGVYRVRVRFAGSRFARPAAAPDLYVRAVRRRESLDAGGTSSPG